LNTHIPTPAEEDYAGSLLQVIPWYWVAYEDFIVEEKNTQMSKSIFPWVSEILQTPQMKELVAFHSSEYSGVGHSMPLILHSQLEHVKICKSANLNHLSYPLIILSRDKK
jgi:uncharacterized protein YllA (UPF0747 family)